MPVAPPTFRELSPQAQKLRLRQDAFAVLRDYPLEVARLSCLNHGFNTTFRVDAADGTRYALRLNACTHRRPAYVRGEIAWLTELGRETDLAVPRPLARRDGALLSTFFSQAMGREIMAVLFAWLPGPTLELESPPDHFRAVGAFLAQLHRHAVDWSIPPDVAFPDGRLLAFGWPDQLAASDLPDADKAVFAEAGRRAQAALDAVNARHPVHVLHGDLHPWNVKRCRGRTIVFDFDDSAFGPSSLDLATTSFYLRRAPRGVELDDAFRAGYESVLPWPDTTPVEQEALQAGRQFFLSNDLVAIENAELRDETAKYLAKGVSRLRTYLATGEFPRFDPPA
ncbi:MAG: phosphotransferase [Verrucomicrobia bacterium]|nr:phosphotransferase [Verrucomicrobiota bacterium]